MSRSTVTSVCVIDVRYRHSYDLHWFMQLYKWTRRCLHTAMLLGIEWGESK